MSKQRGFTLIEMLVVIVIIGILLSMTLGFGASRVKDLDIQGVSDQFVDAFTTVVGQSRSSSYFYGHKYSSLLIHFVSGANMISSSLSGADDPLLSSIFRSSTFSIATLLAGNQPHKKLDVVLQPYGIGCQLLSDDAIFSGATIVATISKQNQCYTLDTSLCTLKKVACK